MKEIFENYQPSVTHEAHTKCLLIDDRDFNYLVDNVGKYILDNGYRREDFEGQDVIKDICEEAITDLMEEYAVSPFGYKYGNTTLIEKRGAAEVLVEYILNKFYPAKNVSEFEKAIEYVRKHKTWSDAEDERALELTERCRCNIQQADPTISDEIHDLMEEYSDENDLPEGWWLREGDEDDVFFRL